jgi:hypothetical protein
MRKHVSKILATSEPPGNLEEVERLVKKVADTDADVIAVRQHTVETGSVR